MSPIGLFNIAFNDFLNTGCFEFSDSSLSLKQLQTIQAHLRKYPVPLGLVLPFYEIHLNNVELIPFHIEELIEQRELTDTIVSGNVTEEEKPASLKSHLEVNFQSEDKVFSMLNYMEAYNPREANYDLIKEPNEKILLSLFEIAKWQVIKLENINIVGEKGREVRQLNFEFVADLYDTLSLYADHIKEFSLKNVDLFNKNALLDFLNKTSKLQILRLEDNLKNQIFKALNESNAFLKHLCEALVNHSTLEQLDLGETDLNEDDYLELLTLSDNNYRLDKIFVKKPPVLSNLTRLYEEFIERMDKRSRKTGLERFRDKQLTINNLYKLAELGLESDTFNFIKLSLTHAVTERLAITHTNRFLSDEFIRKLPEGFRRFPEYTQQCWPMCLDVSQRLENQTTIGANLLEKAYQLRRPQYMQLLLAAGADLLEQLPDKLSLVKRVFSDKEEEVYKQIILKHVKKDLSVFVPFISRLLPSYKKIDGGLRNIKLQLDHFVTTLLELDQLPFLLKLFKGIGLETKKENWEKDFRLVIQAAQVGTHKNPVTHSALSDFEQTLEVLYLEVDRAKKQWFRGYQFNRNLLESLKQLLKLTREYQSKLFREWEGQQGGSLVQANIVELQQKWIKSEEEKKEIIKKFEAREQLIKAEMEAKYAQALSNLEARMKAEMEVKYMQNCSDLEARLEAKLNKFSPHATQQPVVSTTDSRTAENSTRFFTKP